MTIYESALSEQISFSERFWHGADGECARAHAPKFDEATRAGNRTTLRPTVASTTTKRPSSDTQASVCRNA